MEGKPTEDEPTPSDDDDHGTHLYLWLTLMAAVLTVSVRGYRGGGEGMTKLGDALRAARGTVSQQRLAERIGVTQAAISQYETGAVIPRPEKVVAIAVELGLPPEDLLADVGYYQPRRPSARKEPDTTYLAPEDEERVRDTARVLAGLVHRLIAPRLWPRVLAELSAVLQSMPAWTGRGLGVIGQDWLRDEQWQQDEQKATRDLNTNRFERYPTAEGVLSRLKN